MANVGTAAAGKTLIGAGNGKSPTYADIGTNSGLTAHGIVIAEGNSAFTVVIPGISGYVLTSNGASSDPTFQALPASGITITGDSGSLTGSSITVYADTAARKTGSSVSFTNSGSTSLFSLSDASFNIFLGKYAGTLSNSSAESVGIGYASMYQTQTSQKTSCFGSNSGYALTQDSNNTAIGAYSLNRLTTGTTNACLGYLAGNSYTSSESNNLCLLSTGTIGDSGAIRIGTSGTQTQCFVAGVQGVSVSNALSVVINSATGQMGTIPTAKTIVTTYTSGSGTWTMNTSTKFVEVYGWAGGGGGGSGRKGTSAASSGGGGGAPGALFYFRGPASSFSPSQSYSVGAGGAGGVAQTTDATNGNPGIIGGDTTFGALGAVGGNFGLAGVSGFTAGGAGGNSYAMISYFGTIGGGSCNNAAGGTPSADVNMNATGGGGGSGANTATAQQAGGGGTIKLTSTYPLYTAAAGGIETGTINGGTGVSSPSGNATFIGGGGGGGGGGAKSGATGGTGGPGGTPGGGGGGGGGGISTQANSGAGGKGGDGVIVVIEYL